MDKPALFQFRLTPVKQVIGWDRGRSLHWFGLTDGAFWMSVGGQELFRYTQAIRDFWARDYPHARAISRYGDYFLARYWEDLIEMLPAILSPVPQDLAKKIADAPRWRQWLDAASDWRENHDDDASWDLYQVAVTWWSGREWDAGHLNAPPNVALWTVGDSVRIRWDNRDVELDGLRVWEAQQGEFILPIAAFREEVLSFDRRLMAAMAERVKQVRHGVLDPKISIDVAALEREQDDRSQWMRRAIDQPAEHFAWDEVRTAMTAISP